MSPTNMEDFEMSRTKQQQWTNYQGTRRKNMDGYWYTVGERTGGSHYGKPLYEVIFDSGYRTEMTSQDIWRNKLKDWGSPSVYGIGIVGWTFRNPTKHPLWNRWVGMLERCYKCRPNYEDVTVCKRWRQFDLFVQDAERLECYDPKRLGELQLDKDKLGPETGPREYGPETCSWLTSAEQAVYRRPWRKTKAPHCPYRCVHETEGKWHAKPQAGVKRIRLGRFADALDAALAILRAFPDFYYPHEKARIAADVEARRTKGLVAVGSLGQKAA